MSKCVAIAPSAGSTTAAAASRTGRALAVNPASSSAAHSCIYNLTVAMTICSTSIINALIGRGN